MTFKGIWIFDASEVIAQISTLIDPTLDAHDMVEIVLYAQIEANYINHHAHIHHPMVSSVSALALAYDFIEEYHRTLVEEQQAVFDPEKALQAVDWIYSWFPMFDPIEGSVRCRHRWHGVILIVEQIEWQH